MDKEKFNKLTIEEQIREFNKIILEQGSINKASKFLNIPKSTLRDSFTKNGYILNGETKQYVKDTNTPTEGQTSPTEPVNENKGHTETNMIETKQEQDIKSLIEQTVNELLADKMAEIFKAQQELENRFKAVDEQFKNSKFNNNIVISGRCTGECKARSFEVYEDILNEFIEFCETQPYTKRELVSQAMIEFIENHKK